MKRFLILRILTMRNCGNPECCARKVTALGQERRHG
jgi:hypothetical protein